VATLLSGGGGVQRRQRAAGDEPGGDAVRGLQRPSSDGRAGVRGAAIRRGGGCTAVEFSWPIALESVPDFNH
jgi:hypothetical protein